MIRTESNNPVVVKILDNDDDPDGDNLRTTSITSPTNNGGTVTINDNDSITCLPAADFVGVDRFSYTISDGNGNSDTATVTAIVKAVRDSSKPDQTSQEILTTQDRQVREQQDADQARQKNQAENGQANDTETGTS